MKIIKDTLQVNGNWSQKRVLTFTSFYVAVAYAFMPIFVSTFIVNEFVFLGLLSAGGFSVYQSQKEKNENSNQLN